MPQAQLIRLLAWASLAAGLLCAGWIAWDIRRRPQPMAVMNLVWPLSATFGGPLALTFYLWRGQARLRGRTRGHHTAELPVAIATGALHCGAGCAVADLTGELLLAIMPGLASVFGLGWLFHDPAFATWSLDYLLALAFGIAFQYFAIAPMRHLGLFKGLLEAAKADVLSLTAWQVGMYGAMALGLFKLFPALTGARPVPSQPEFWWLMQWAMLTGFVTSLPVNWGLIRLGVKEPM